MISILVSSRVQDNPDSNLHRLITSTVDTMLPGEEVEFLVKYDRCDHCAPDCATLSKYPVPVRRFVWAQGEGRHALHTVYEYLFTRINPKSKLVLIDADDFIHNRKGWITDAMHVQSKHKYCMITGEGECAMRHTSGRIERVPSGPAADFYDQRYPDWDKMPEDKYRETMSHRYQRLQLTLPMFTRDFLEVAQNLGWQTNTDTWCALLECMFYDMYNMKIWKRIPVWYDRTGGTETGSKPPFYNDMEMPAPSSNVDPMYFTLLKRQVQNLYLTMKHEGLA